MKKIILVAIAALALGFNANAQMYVGGALGCKVDHSEFSGAISPEIGYTFNDYISAGAYVTFAGAKDVFQWNINPYFRLTFIHWGDFGIFGEASVGVGTYKVTGWESQTDWNILVTPGLSYRAGEHWTIIGRIGNLGYERNGTDGHFSFNLNMTPSFGLPYNF